MLRCIGAPASSLPASHHECIYLTDLMAPSRRRLDCIVAAQQWHRGLPPRADDHCSQRRGRLAGAAIRERGELRNAALCEREKGRWCFLPGDRRVGEACSPSSTSDFFPSGDRIWSSGGLFDGHRLSPANLHRTPIFDASR